MCNEYQFSFNDPSFIRDSPEYLIDGVSVKSLINFANKYAIGGGGACQVLRIGSISQTMHLDNPQSLDDFRNCHTERHGVDVYNRAMLDIKRRMRLLQRQATILTGMRTLPGRRVNEEIHPHIQVWVLELALYHSYTGKRIEIEIMNHISGEMEYTIPSLDDESSDIDGWFENYSFSIKPESWFNDDGNFPQQLGNDDTRVISYRYENENGQITVNYSYRRNAPQ